MENKALFKLGYGLYVVTTNDKGKDNGCIINTCMQVTDTPKKIVIAMNKANKTHDMIISSKVFNISILTTDAEFDLFKHFGFQSGDKVDKFKTFVDKNRADNGILYITKQTNAYIGAKVEQVIDMDTHSLFIATVTEEKVLNDNESVTYEYYHKYIKDKIVSTELNEKKGYRCVICGYVYEGDKLPPDYICPLCKHGVEDFERI